MATSRFRGETFHITVHNSAGAGRAAPRMEVDGRPVGGNLVTPGPRGGERNVEVWLEGEAAS
jgi:hypothetical protein